jgi:Helix-turn-helix domain
VACLTPRAIGAGGSGVPGLAGAGLGGLEPVYTPEQIAAYLGLDTSTVRRLFQDTAGVVRIGRTEARGGKRQYCTLRVPQSVLQRFIRERSK